MYKILKILLLFLFFFFNNFLFANVNDLYCKKIPVTMFYAGYKTSNGSTNYVYLNLDRGFLLNIIPPKAYGDKPTITPITNDFTSLPNIVYEKCTYDAPTQSWLDSNGNLCNGSYQIYLIFTAQKGNVCSSSAKQTQSSQNTDNNTSIIYPPQPGINGNSSNIAFPPSPGINQ